MSKDDRTFIESQLLTKGYRYAVALSHNHHDAEDLVQEAWLRYYRHAPKGDSPYDTGYFLRIIRNLFIDGYRRSKVIEISPLGEQIESTAHAPEGALNGDPTRAAGPESGEYTIKQSPGSIEWALAQINGAEREAIFLSVFEEMTAKEIAKLMGCSRGTVLSRIARGKEKLGRLLKNEPLFRTYGGTK